MPIVGRQFLRDRIGQFLDSCESGIFLLTSPPGVGKTAFLAQWVADHPDTVHFFFRATVSMTDPDECVKSLYQALLAKYGIREKNPTNDRVELRSRLREWLLRQVSGYCARHNHKEVIVIDALDEAGETDDGKSVLRVLPTELPPHVYLLLAARPVPLAEELARREGVHHFHLDPTGQENMCDAQSYAGIQLCALLRGAPLTRLDQLTLHIAGKSKGNFLLIKTFLSKDFVGERVGLEELERQADLLTGEIAAIYEQFLSRVTERLRYRPAELDRLYRVLGALVTAQGPVTREQVCAAFGMSSARWDWAFALVSQFLERGGVRQEEQGALTYRLYHETFREFLLNRLAPDLCRSHRLWAEYCLDWRELRGYARLYALRYLPTHLIEASKR
jgi:hypothetical protein